MRKARKIPDFDNLKEEIKNNIENMDELISNNWKNIPKKIMFWVQAKVFYSVIACSAISIIIFICWNFWFENTNYEAAMFSNPLSIISLIGLVSSGLVYFIHFRMKKKVNKLTTQGINKEAIYKKCFQEMKYVELKQIIPSSQVLAKHRSELWKYRKAGIPSDARVCKEYDMFIFELFNRYQIRMRFGTMTWTRQTGKTTTRYYKDTGYFIMDTIDSEYDNLSLSLSSRHKFFREEKLENREFVKKFHLETNNKIKARMIFTPLAMENMLNLKPQLKGPWEIKIHERKLIISFSPSKVEKLLSIDFKIKNKETASQIEKKIKEDIAGDTIEVYRIMHLIFGISLF